jgi:hypothetical protein
VGVLEMNDNVMDGYTLVIPSSYTSTYLIDNCGRIINQWDSELTAGFMAYLLPDGRLLRAGKKRSIEFGAGGAGGTIEIFSWEGNLEWSYSYSSERVQHHHDVEYLPNGNILLIAWVKLTEDEILNIGRDLSTIDMNRGLWSESVVELRPIGSDDAEVVWEWFSHDHYIQDIDSTANNYGSVVDHPELLDINFPYSPLLTADWIHFNSIDYNAELDQILLGSRNHNEIYIIDHSTTIAEAASHSGGRYGKGGDFLYRWGNPEVYKRGTSDDRKLFAQHDPHWIDAHNEDNSLVMIYNNGIGRNPFYSSIDVLDTGHDNGVYSIDSVRAFGPTELEWTIEDRGSQFSSPRVSGAQFLENRSTLICSGNNGRLVELTESEEVSWVFESPVSNMGPIPQGFNASLNDMFRSFKYAPDFPALVGRDLTPGDFLVLNETDINCTTTSVAEEDDNIDIKIFPNPVTDILFIESELSNDAYYELYDSKGSLVQVPQKLLNNKINLSTLHTGIYLIKIIDNDLQSLQKVIKL